MRARHYGFTIHNPTKKDLTRLKKVGQESAVNFIVYSAEQGKTGQTPHIQGYVQLSAPYRYTGVNKLFALPDNQKFHVQNINGTWQENVVYIVKELPQFSALRLTDKRNRAKHSKGKLFEALLSGLQKLNTPDFHISGQPVTQGQRTDLIHIKDEILAGTSVKALVEDGQLGTYQQVAFAEKVATLVTRPEPRTQKPITEWIAGPTGIGKTRSVYDRFGSENIYLLRLDGSNFPLDRDYIGQQVLFLDDFRPWSLKFEILLKLLDWYPMVLPTKYDQPRHINSQHIIITAPLLPEALYARVRNDRYQRTEEDIAQLTRRLDKCTDLFDSNASDEPDPIEIDLSDCPL